MIVSLIVKYSTIILPYINSLLHTTHTFISLQIAGQPLAELVKNHFVPIFSVSMALHCSERPGNEMAAMVLQSSILHLAEISEDERDKLIKKHMVCFLYFNNGSVVTFTDHAYLHIYFYLYIILIF